MHKGSTMIVVTKTNQKDTVVAPDRKKKDQEKRLSKGRRDMTYLYLRHMGRKERVNSDIKRAQKKSGNDHHIAYTAEPHFQSQRLSAVKNMGK
jgi:hypothetical protein